MTNSINMTSISLPPQRFNQLLLSDKPAWPNQIRRVGNGQPRVISASGKKGSHVDRSAGASKNRAARAAGQDSLLSSGGGAFDHSVTGIAPADADRGAGQSGAEKIISLDDFKTQFNQQGLELLFRANPKCGAELRRLYNDPDGNSIAREFRLPNIAAVYQMATLAHPGEQVKQELDGIIRELTDMMVKDGLGKKSIFGSPQPGKASACLKVGALENKLVGVLAKMYGEGKLNAGKILYEKHIIPFAIKYVEQKISGKLTDESMREFSQYFDRHAYQKTENIFQGMEDNISVDIRTIADSFNVQITKLHFLRELADGLAESPTGPAGVQRPDGPSHAAGPEPLPEVPRPGPEAGRTARDDHQAPGATYNTYNYYNNIYAPTQVFAPTNQTFAPTNQTFAPTNLTFAPTNLTFAPTNLTFAPANNTAAHGDRQAGAFPRPGAARARSADNLAGRPATAAQVEPPSAGQAQGVRAGEPLTAAQAESAAVNSLGALARAYSLPPENAASRRTFMLTPPRDTSPTGIGGAQVMPAGKASAGRRPLPQVAQRTASAIRRDYTVTQPAPAAAVIDSRPAAIPAPQRSVPLAQPRAVIGDRAAPRHDAGPAVLSNQGKRLAQHPRSQAPVTHFAPLNQPAEDPQVLRAGLRKVDVAARNPRPGQENNDPRGPHTAQDAGGRQNPRPGQENNGPHGPHAAQDAAGRRPLPQVAQRTASAIRRDYTVTQPAPAAAVIDSRPAAIPAPRRAAPLAQPRAVIGDRAAPRHDAGPAVLSNQGKRLAQHPRSQAPVTHFAPLNQPAEDPQVLRAGLRKVDVAARNPRPGQENNDPRGPHTAQDAGGRQNPRPGQENNGPHGPHAAQDAAGRRPLPQVAQRTASAIRRDYTVTQPAPAAAVIDSRPAAIPAPRRAAPLAQPRAVIGDRAAPSHDAGPVVLSNQGKRLAQHPRSQAPVTHFAPLNQPAEDPQVLRAGLRKVDVAAHNLRPGQENNDPHGPHAAQDAAVLQNPRPGQEDRDPRGPHTAQDAGGPQNPRPGQENNGPHGPHAAQDAAGRRPLPQQVAQRTASAIRRDYTVTQPAPAAAVIDSRPAAIPAPRRAAPLAQPRAVIGDRAAPSHDAGPVVLSNQGKRLAQHPRSQPPARSIAPLNQPAEDLTGVLAGLKNSGSAFRKKYE
ncbi:hypothetical protein ACL2XP_22985 [Sodalis sp. RH21]|uniref:hypothetical protein n=1 Tax=unclassified Sodalis (in: enterobacteria) TaxID=2636512 RepID=UPI0039B36FA7